MSIENKRPGRQLRSPLSRSGILQAEVVKTTSDLIEYNDTFGLTVSFQDTQSNSVTVSGWSWLEIWTSDDGLQRTGSVVSSPTASTSASSYSLVCTPPVNVKGTLEFIVTEAVSTTGATLSNEPSIKVAFDTEVPQVSIGKAQLGSVIRDQSITFTFNWNQELVSDVTLNRFEFSDINFSSSIRLGNAPTLDMTSFAIDEMSTTLYTVQVTFAENSAGIISISVSMNAAQALREVTNSKGETIHRQGPRLRETLTLDYDLTTALPPVTVTPANLQIVIPRSTPYLYTQATIEFVWDRDVSQFTIDDISATLGTFSNFTEIGEQTIGSNTRYVWQAILTLPTGQDSSTTISVDADIARSRGADMDNSPPENVERSFDFDVSGAIGLIPTSDDNATITSICSETYAFNALPSIYSANSSGAFVGFMDFEALDNTNLFATLQIQKKREGVDSELDFQEQGEGVLLHINTSGTCIPIKRYNHITEAARSFILYNNSLAFFEGNVYSYERQGIFRDIAENIGILRRVDTTGNISEIGVAWTGRDPIANEINFTGRYGGMIAPMIVANNDLYLIAGYNSQTTDNEDFERIDNWNLLKYGTDLEFRIPELQTNNRTGFNVLQELASITDSIIGFDKEGTFFFIPKSGYTARFSSISGSTVTYTNTNRDFPNSGTFLIDDELFTYTGRTSTTFTGITRAVSNTDEATHMGGSDLYYVDHVISLNESNTAYKMLHELRSELDTDQFYNSYRIEYGDENTNPEIVSSITGKRKEEYELNLSRSLDRHQKPLVRWIGNQQLARTRNVPEIFNIELKMSFHIEPGQYVYLLQEAYAHVKHLCQVVSVRPLETEEVTHVKLVKII